MTTMSKVFLFNETATTEIYTLSLHDALPILQPLGPVVGQDGQALGVRRDQKISRFQKRAHVAHHAPLRSEEHTSELQSRQYLVCRLLLEKKNTPPCLSLPPPPHSFSLASAH